MALVRVVAPTGQTALVDDTQVRGVISAGGWMAPFAAQPEEWKAAHKPTDIVGPKMFAAHRPSVPPPQADGTPMFTMDTEGRVKATGDIEKGLLDLIPGGMGMLGALVGLPGAPASGGASSIGGAALMGGIGRSVRNNIAKLRGRDDLTSGSWVGDNITSPLGEAALQGTTELGGQVIAAGARAAGRSLMREALNPTKLETLAENVVQPVTAMRGTPVWERALEARTPVTREGASKALRLTDQMRDQKALVLGAMKEGGRRYTASDLYDEAEKQIAKSMRNALTADDRVAIRKMVMDILNAKRTTSPWNPELLGGEVSLTPQDMDFMKSQMQTRARALYLAAEKGLTDAAAAKSGRLEAQTNRTLASAARRRLARDAKTDTGVDLNAVNRGINDMRGLELGILKGMSARPAPFRIGQPMTYPVLNNPAVQSHFALGLTDPRLLRALQVLGHGGLPVLGLSSEVLNSQQDETLYP